MDLQLNFIPLLELPIYDQKLHILTYLYAISTKEGSYAAGQGLQDDPSV